VGKGVVGNLDEEKGGNLGEEKGGNLGEEVGNLGEGWIMHEKHEKNIIKKTYKKNIGKKHKIIDIQSDF
jgi:hypothetical protein